MTGDARLLKRLYRLERMRAIARQEAAAVSAEAEAALTQIEALAERTRRLSRDYAGKPVAADGAALRSAAIYACGLRDVHARTQTDADHARQHADRKRTALAEAERRRAAADDRARRMGRQLARGEQFLPTGTRKGFGTGLE